MRIHRGIRPHDIVILLKLAIHQDRKWQKKELASELFISPSEITESINRSEYGGLISSIDEMKVMKKAFLDYLKYGLPYTFPQRPGAIVRGIPTAHSADPLAKIIQSETAYVWKSSDGKMKGQAILPLYKGVIEAIKVDGLLYEGLALLDAIRVGRAREKQLAASILEKMLNHSYVSNS